MTPLSRLPEYLYLPTGATELNQAQRLFHGRGHAYEGLNHISIDWLPPVLLITLYAPESEEDLHALTSSLQALLPSCRSVQVQYRYQSNGPIQILRGDVISELILEENRLKFQVRLGKNRNMGLFLDMKNGRDWVFKHSKNQRVLNLFAYTCGFSVAAIAGGARSVFNVDMSSGALTIGRENHRLNGHSLNHVEFGKLNIFKSFGRLRKRDPFDLLICDPPTFQQGSVDIAKDYAKILRRLDQFTAPGARLLLCLNAPHLAQSFLIDQVNECAPEYNFVEAIAPPPVFVDAEGRGLKVLSFQRD